MIFCNGCSKTGTHILTSFAKNLGFHQVGGTLIKRTPKSPLIIKGKTKIKDVFTFDNNNFVHCHFSYTGNLRDRIAEGNHKHMHIYRHPRNVAVSWMKHRVKERKLKNEIIEPSKEYLKEIISSQMFNMSVVKYYSGFSNWISDQNSLNVRFEDFFQDFDRVSSEILLFLNIQNKKPLKEKVLGNSITYSGQISDWRDWWDEEINLLWIETGGLSLEKKLGY